MTTLDKFNPVRSNSAKAITRVNPASKSRPVPLRQELADDGRNLPASEAPVEEAPRDELDEAVRNISGYVQNISRELNFRVDEELGRTVVTVSDRESGELIRQIPSEEMLEIARSVARLKEKRAKGILFDEDA